MDDAVPVYQAWLVHMCRYGLDQGKNEDLLKDIDETFSMDVVNKINNDLGDDNFAECWWAIKEQYIAQRPGCTEQQVQEFQHTVIKLVIKNPWVFIKSRIAAWNYIAWKMNSHNLYIPLLIIIAGLIWGILRKNWLYIFMFSGIIIHTGLTILFMPASYFNYFFAMYLVAYLVFGIFCIHAIKRFFSKDGNFRGNYR